MRVFRDTLMAVTDAWIEPDTAVINDYWAAYRDLDAQGYTHSSGFVDQRTGSHQHHRVHVASTTERGTTFTTLLITCSRRGDQFTRFLHLVATMDWSACPPPPLESCATWCTAGQRPSYSASPTTVKCACLQQQVVHVQGHFPVFSATTKHHKFTLGTDNLLRQPPYLLTIL